MFPEGIMIEGLSQPPLSLSLIMPRPLKIYDFELKKRYETVKKTTIDKPGKGDLKVMI